MYIHLDGGKLRGALYAAGSSQKNLAGEVGVSTSWMNALFGGRRCSLEQAEKIAAALGVGVGDLIRKED